MITSDGEPVAHFDLDALESEAREEIFTFRLGGEVFQMLPPEEADWQVATDLSDGTGLRAFMRELLGEKDYERFAQHKLSTAKLTRLIDECSNFYGVTPGESQASKRSSRNTRRR
jgi:hypothetical protein